MTITNAMEIMKKEYERAKKNPQITNPLGYACYKTWRVVDSNYKKTKEKV